MTEEQMREWTDPKKEKQIERRTITDINGVKKEQIRFVPIEPWEPSDGWRTTKVLTFCKA